MIKHTKLALAAAVAATMACASTTALAQSADALIDKLVDKGILTVQEANDLREETDKNFTTAYATKSGMPEWVTALKFNGDFRGRYESFFSDHPAAVERHRLQYRLRFGVTAQLTDRFETGLRLASAGDTTGNPISSNQTLDNNASKKGLAVDLAYGKWQAVDNADWSLALTGGKMEMPLVVPSTYIDRDYTPEGLGQQVKWNVAEHHVVGVNLGQFVLDEDGGGTLDSWMLAAQFRVDSTWSEKLKSSAGVAVLHITDPEALRASRGQLDIGEGNTRVGNIATNAPAYDFHPIFADADLTYTVEKFPLYPGAMPIKLGGSFLHNPGAPTENNGYNIHLTLGKAGKRGTWEVGYEYRVLEADAIYEELPESDFNAFTAAARMTGGRRGFVNGTNIRGHIIRLGYAPVDAFSLNAAFWLTENILETPAGSDSDATRIQVDAIWKF
jgi:hypothetical protein